MRPANWSDDEKADYTARIVELYSRHEELTPQEIARTAQEQAQEMNDGWTSHDELEAIFFRGIRKASIVHHFDNSDDSREVEFLSATQDVRFSLDMITRDGARQWWGGVSVPITDDKAYEDVEHPDGTWSGLSRPDEWHRARQLGRFADAGAHRRPLRAAADAVGNAGRDASTQPRGIGKFGRAPGSRPRRRPRLVAANNSIARRAKSPGSTKFKAGAPSRTSRCPNASSVTGRATVRPKTTAICINSNRRDWAPTWMPMCFRFPPRPRCATFDWAKSASSSINSKTTTCPRWPN